MSAEQPDVSMAGEWIAAERTADEIIAAATSTGTAARDSSLAGTVQSTAAQAGAQAHWMATMTSPQTDLTATTPDDARYFALLSSPALPAEIQDGLAEPRAAAQVALLTPIPEEDSNADVTRLSETDPKNLKEDGQPKVLDPSPLALKSPIPGLINAAPLVPPVV